MKKLFLVVFIVMMALPAAYAGKLANNAGCGLGTLMFDTLGKPNGGWLLQATANYTNVTLTNTWSMTTGTVNCQGNINQVVSNEVYQFVGANMDNLAKEIAQGKGETINSVAKMLNVSDVEVYSTVLQANFAEIFPSASVSAVEVANKLAELA